MFYYLLVLLTVAQVDHRQAFVTVIHTFKIVIANLEENPFVGISYEPYQPVRHHTKTKE